MDSDTLREAFERMDTGQAMTYSANYALFSYTSMLLNHFETARFLHQRGFLEEEHWRSDVANLAGMLSDSGARATWDEVERRYRDTFVLEIEAALRDMPPGAVRSDDEADEEVVIDQ